MESWTLDKIKQYIKDGIEENLNLDYKGAASIDKKLSQSTDKHKDKKKELSKDVSAFANSDGGVIIYGVKEFDDKSKNHLPENIDPINGTEYTKEWIEQVINSSIKPRIPDIKIIPIQTAKKEENKVIYVVEIPKSTTAHQAIDKKYYRWYNFESIAMDDWEIKDIINRQNKSNIEIKFLPKMDKQFLERILKKDTNIGLIVEVWAANMGNKIAQYVDCFIFGEKDSAVYIFEPFVSRNGYQIHFSNIKERKIEIVEKEFVIGIDRIPILPNTSRVIGKLKIKTDLLKGDYKLKIQIATEDGSKTSVTKTKDLIKLK